MALMRRVLLVLAIAVGKAYSERIPLVRISPSSSDPNVVPLSGAPFIFAANVCFGRNGSSHRHCVPLQLDTGSADVWTVSASCELDDSEQSCCRALEDCATLPSSAYVSNGKPYGDNYDGGSTSGEEANGYIFFGESGASTAFGVVNVMSGMQVSSEMSGILGLGFRASRTSPCLPS